MRTRTASTALTDVVLSAVLTLTGITPAAGDCESGADGGYDPMTDYVETLVYWHCHPTWWPEPATC